MSDDLQAEVRRALNHLYDAVYLQRSPLLELIGRSELKTTGGARALRQALIEAIDLLKPADGLPHRSDEQRPYVALRGRYVQQMDVGELADELGISERQLRREIRAGVGAVTRILQAAGGESSGPPAESAPEPGLDEFADASANLAAEARDLMLLAGPLAGASGARLVEDDLPESLIVRGSRVLLRQALLGLFEAVLLRHPGDRLGVSVEEGEGVVLSVSPARQLAAASEEPFAPVSDEILAALDASVRCTRRPSGHPQYQLLLRSVMLPSVLVVDDNESLHRLFRRYLTGLPYAVLSAYSTEEALTLVREHRPAVLLVDIMMPRHDGWELMCALNALPDTRDIPVVICSVLSQEPLARSLGVAGYLKKPVTQDALVAVLHSVLGRNARQ